MGLWDSLLKLVGLESAKPSAGKVPNIREAREKVGRIVSDAGGIDRELDDFLGPLNAKAPRISKESRALKIPLKKTRSQETSSIRETREFLTAFETMEKTNDVLFVTGEAGTGKTTLLQYFRQKTRKKVAVVTFTGVAALNAGGSTIHSFFHFRPQHFTPDSIRRIQEVADRRAYEALDTLVVDEVSMVSSDLLDATHRFLRMNGKDKSLPFGGLQVIFLGDLFQLPPVIDRGARDNYHPPTGHWESEFFFHAKSMERILPSVRFIELSENHRQQNDQEYFHLLSGLRTGRIDERTLERLNERCQEYPYDVKKKPCTFIVRANLQADKINDAKLTELRGRPVLFTGEIQGSIDRRDSPMRLPSPMKLKLKKGAVVMFTKNDSLGRWVNGTLGTVTHVDEHSIEVNGQRVDRETWETVAYEWDDEKKESVPVVKGSYRQFPLMLAWAITVHKSQGKTLDRVQVDLGNGRFDHGLAYVAMSRCRTLESLFLKNKIQKAQLYYDSRIQDFHHALSIKQRTMRESASGMRLE